jgi:hypothetical protein
MLNKLEGIVLETVQEHQLFSKDEVELLKRVIARERGWAAIGSLAGTLKTVLTWFGFMIGTWMAFKTGFLEWIANGLSGGR